MARIVARTLALAPPASSTSPSLRPAVRGLSSKVEMIEIDLSEESPAGAALDSGVPSSGAAAEGGDSSAQSAGMRRLEDAIHGVLVRRAAPEWLPFVPGGSYWVPPIRRPLGVADLVGTIAHAARGIQGLALMTEEEALSFTSARGWPSSAYFIEGKFPYPVKWPRNDATQADEEES